MIAGPDTAQATAAMAGPMVSFAFYAALTLSVIKIVEVIWPLIRPPGLRVVVTRELIYRILDDTGENFFLNVTLLAERSAVLIESATVTLSKVGATTKNFPLLIRMVGDKIGSPNAAIATHSFYTTSALAFVAQAMPQRIVYLCAMKDYADRAGMLVAEMQTWVAKLREDHGGAAFASASAETRLAVYEELRGRVREGVGQLMETVQLESGEYRLLLVVSYRRPSGLFRPKRNSTSSITFAMPPEMRAVLRGQLISYFEAVFQNLVFGTTNSAVAASVNPLNVVEHPSD